MDHAGDADLHDQGDYRQSEQVRLLDERIRLDLRTGDQSGWLRVHAQRTAYVAQNEITAARPHVPARGRGVAARGAARLAAERAQSGRRHTGETAPDAERAEALAEAQLHRHRRQPQLRLPVDDGRQFAQPVFQHIRRSGAVFRTGGQSAVRPHHAEQGRHRYVRVAALLLADVVAAVGLHRDQTRRLSGPLFTGQDRCRCPKSHLRHHLHHWIRSRSPLHRFRYH